MAVLASSVALPSTTSGQTLEAAAKLIGGAAVGLGLHESAHVVADVASGVAPGLKRVTFGPLPFFAITHDAVSPAREFVISSAGFWMQHAVNEYLCIRTAFPSGSPHKHWLPSTQFAPESS